MLGRTVVCRWVQKQLSLAFKSPSRRWISASATKQDEPLRILFCGSEAFSIASLKALHAYKESGESNILSIDVATRKDKAAGRGLKELRSPEIKRAAAQMGFRVHQFDTFTGWHPPEYGTSQQPYINLVIAVSFGLLVPPRILNGAKFGGINVHPSMLPDLRGAAPINWTIANGYTQTGVTVQTLHPSKFDHGSILAQTPQPGLAIPNPTTITAHELRLLLAPIGAEMLVNTIRGKLYLQNGSDTVPQKSTDTAQHHSLAPKIVPSLKVLNPYTDGLTTILRKNRAMPKLWAEVTRSTESGPITKRIIFGTGLNNAGPEDLAEEEVRQLARRVPIGMPFTVTRTDEDIRQSDNSIYIKVKGRSTLKIPRLLVAGGREGPAAAAAAQAKLFAESHVQGSYQLFQFQQPLSVPLDMHKIPTS